MSVFEIVQALFSVVAVVALYLAWRPNANRGLTRGRMAIAALIFFGIVGALKPRSEVPTGAAPQLAIAEVKPALVGVSAQNLQSKFVSTGMRCNEGKQNSTVVSWTCEADGAPSARVEFNGASASQIGLVTGSLMSLVPIPPSSGEALASTVVEW